MRRLKIRTPTPESDPVTGKPSPVRIGHGIEVIDADTGERIPQVFRVAMDVTAGEVLRAIVEVNLSELDVEVQGDVVGVCRRCGHRKPEGVPVGPVETTHLQSADGTREYR